YSSSSSRFNVCSQPACGSQTGHQKIILLHLSLSRIFSGSAKANRECRMRYLVWFELLNLRPDALPVINNTLLVPGPRRYSLRRSIVMPDHYNGSPEAIPPWTRYPKRIVFLYAQNIIQAYLFFLTVFCIYNIFLIDIFL